MNCYNQLSQPAKFAFNVRLFYISLLTLSSIYCSVLLISRTYTWLPIPIMIANGLSLFNSLLHIVDIIYENRKFPPIEEGLFITVFDIIPNLVILFSIITYIIYFSLGLMINIQQEFALMIIYAIVIGCSIPSLIFFIGYCYLIHRHQSYDNSA